MRCFFNKITMGVTMLLLSSVVWAQDIIITNDAQKIDAKILEVSKSEIRYKEIDNLDGPTFVLETTEINSIIYSNGKVVLYNKDNTTKTTKQEEEKAEDTKYLYIGLDLEAPERTSLIKYLEGYPKNLVAIKGDYSMLYDKRCRIYIDFDYNNAELGVYEYDRTMDEYSERGNFDQFIKDENIEIEKETIIQSACDMFNKLMLDKKSTFFPISKLASSTISKDDYIMLVHIKRIDVGNGAVSAMSNGRTTTGGAIVCGDIEIKQANSGAIKSILLIDRVQGAGNVHASLRIQNVIEEIVANKIFYIKKYKLYSKDL